MTHTLISFCVIIYLIFLTPFQYAKIPLSTTTSTIRVPPNCSCEQKSTDENKLFPTRKKKEIFRLPTTITPLEYNLSLKIDFLNFRKNRFEEALGNVTITIQVRKPTNFILLHCDDNISLNSIVVNSMKNRGYNLVANFTHLDVLNISLTSLLEKDGIYVIHINNFTTRFNFNEDSGIISRRFESENGTFDYIIATQLEPESARKLLPCFDEPAFKSVFNLKIATNDDFSILTNTPEKSCQQAQNWKVCTFESTPMMSTYNLAFSINNFEFVEHRDWKNVVYRVWTRKSQIHKSAIALNYTVKVFEMFEQMFDLELPLKKVDSLAIPNLKGFLGMEHFGLITYDESVLVQDERYPLTFARQLCVLIICHEVSHQWFGNIVTTAWWKDLWLNEGFATYYSYRVAGQIMNNEMFFPLERLSMIKYVKHMDDIYSRPRSTINFPVVDKAETKFDYLSYKKGFLVINMLEKVINTTAFDISMKYYLREHKYGSVFPEQLWKSINLFTNINVEEVLKNWISKLCYPLIKVSIHQNSTINVTQKSSIKLDYKNVTTFNNEYLTNRWTVPLFVIHGNESFQSSVSLIFFNQSEGELIVSKFNASNHWIIINSDYNSFFTTDYDDKIIDRLIVTFLNNHRVISPQSRAHILQDFYDSSKGNLLDNFQRLFKLLSYIKNETHPVPLVTAINLIDKLNGLFELRTFYLDWRGYVSNVFKSSFEKLVEDFSYEFKNDDSTDVILRRSLLNLACKFKFKYCESITAPIIERWKNDSLLEVDFDLLHIALCRYIQQDELGLNWINLYKSKFFQSWDFISTKYYAMGCSKIHWAVEKNVDIALNVLQNINERPNTPHVSSVVIDDVPADDLRGITSLTNILVLSSIYNNPNFQMILIRFSRSSLTLLCNSIIYEPHFPIPKSIIEYAIPTLSHYRFAKRVYNLYDYIKDTFLLDAKLNIDWMQKTDKVKIYLREYN